MNIWYFHHYAAPPELGAPMRAHYLAKSLSEQGHVVTIFSASYHHLRTSPAPVCEHFGLSLHDGVRYYHLPTREYAGNGKNRLLNMLDFSRGVKNLDSRVNDGELESPDVIIMSSPHLLSFSSARKIAAALQVKLIFEVRDLWPLSLVDLAGVSPWHPLVLWMGCIEKKAYRHADAVVSLLSNADQYMVEKGLDREAFHYIPNGVDVDEWNSMHDDLPDEHKQLFDKLKSQNKVIVVYAGAHGLPNALDQILDLGQLPDSQSFPYHVVMIGDGLLKKDLVKRTKEENLSFVSFLPKLCKSQALKAISMADICFIGWLNKRIYRYGVSPNKLCDYFMAAKPVIHAIATKNDLVSQAKAGISTAPYDVEQLDSALKQMCSYTAEERDIIGHRGREYALNHLNWKVLGARYSELIEKIVGG